MSRCHATAMLTPASRKRTLLRLESATIAVDFVISAGAPGSRFAIMPANDHCCQLLMPESGATTISHSHVARSASTK
jgi:hypothetical protein